MLVGGRSFRGLHWHWQAPLLLRKGRTTRAKPLVLAGTRSIISSSARLTAFRLAKAAQGDPVSKRLV